MTSSTPSRPPAPPQDTALAQAVAEQCDMGAWMRFAPQLARLGQPQPADWVAWLQAAPLSEQVEAQQLLRAMSRHRWQIGPAHIVSRPRERLQVTLQVNGRRWHVALADSPLLHALVIDPHPEARA